MALASSQYRDPMEVAAANQARERRQQRERIANSPLPEYPRRWIKTEAKEGWSAARERAEALFTDAPEETPAQSAARVAAEALFARL